MADLMKTPLYGLHLELGAKMTAFAGYAMPLHYANGIIREHLHCRSQAGLFDISHMGQCLILGERAAEVLENLTPGGIVELAIGAQKYTVLTNPAGGVIDDIIVARIDRGLSLIVNAGCKDKDYAYLAQRLPDNCVLQIRPELALLALQGPEAAVVMNRFSAEAVALDFMQTCRTRIDGIDCRISRSGYTGEDGFEISVRQTDAETIARLLLAEPCVEPIGLGARDTLRLEAGLCLYGHELSETISPLQAGLKWLFKKGHADFPGATKILSELDGVPQTRVGLLVVGKIPVREGCAVTDEQGQQQGIVTSGSFSPSLQRPVAMALIHSDMAKIGKNLFAQVRGQSIAVTVAHLPFVPHRYHRS
ncbi:glycine cleavage system aminomethyltransferase GcvT [Methylomonas methanica]|uniref:aminomethyltransferase n=1 Tax=Methylomonas methanica (strain DSM 25384 / MC09) TaxID=857087 RepID=G0A6W2_METMM|nr:glycine cleavage system aminomethyltransferase GcvT [Methylomonas methanica]AEG00583.1 glycine cleavage system T protein [Methylomonas methanica MC09]